jgi:phosphoglycerate kinase
LFGAKKPFTAILGGAKVSSKITIIEKLLEQVDHLIIGGGMMFTFIKATGGQVGSSLVEDEHLETALRVLEVAKKNNVQIHLAQDAILADKFANDAHIKEGDSGRIEPGWMGLDIGPETIQVFAEVIRQSKTLLWNGPMGVFEMPNFEKGTKAVALAIAEATQNGAFSLVGGGDSVAAVNQMGLEEKVGYVSTGGGALLEYIEFHDLPGIKAIRGERPL